MSQKRRDIAAPGRRLHLQLFSLAAFNSYYLARVGKYLCIPVLNCYSCPIGTIACPIGSLTAFALLRRIPYYIFAVLAVAGLAVGRAFCGWACPFGFFQDLLYRIRSRKWNLPRSANWVKYAVLAVLVIGLPLLLGKGKAESATDRIVNEKVGAVDFCGLICPVGTLEASLPNLIMNEEVRAQAYWRTWSKIGLLGLILALAVVSRRSFCRLLCPLGGLMALSWPISLLRLKTNVEKCTRCNRCVKVCPTDCRFVPQEAGKPEATAECLLCLDCVRACPEAGALSAHFAGHTVSVSREKSSE